MFSLIWPAMIVGFPIQCVFNMGEFLAREMRNRVVGDYKALLAYLYKITQIRLAAGFVEIPEINEMIEARRIFDIGLIQDAANPLAQPIRQDIDAMMGLFSEDY